MNILVTNDDGIQSAGIRTLIEIAKEFGNVTVLAPDSPQSAKSHSITVEIPISYKLIEKTDNYKEYSCSGTPVDCVKLAIHELVPQKPDLILSGINHGQNTSLSVIYSGTMAAVVEGTMNKIQSIGFSVNNVSPDIDFSQTKPFIREIIRKVIDNKLPAGVCLNVNFPDIEKFKIKGVKVCRAVNGVWKEKFVSANNKYKNAFWLTGEFENFEPHAKDTDEYAVQNGYASVVPVKFDFTDYSYIDNLKTQGFEK